MLRNDFDEDPGWRPKLVGAATCLVLIMFGTAMAVSLGMESPLSYSVFSAASAAAAYAILDTTSPAHATDTTQTIDLCNGADPVCSGGNDVCAQGLYVEAGQADQAAEFVRDRLQAT